MGSKNGLVFTLIFIASIVLISGCGSDPPPLADVTDTVTFDGDPLTQGTIVFDISGQRTAYGDIVNGQIQDMTTFEDGDGAPLGEAKIAIHSLGDLFPPDESSSETEPGDVPGDAPGDGGNSGMKPGV